jgi:hypothetical protein
LNIFQTNSGGAALHPDDQPVNILRVLESGGTPMLPEPIGIVGLAGIPIRIRKINNLGL